ncbi:hypothetical protein ACFQ0T_27475 [Kitasatospora gansuensis]
MERDSTVTVTRTLSVTPDQFAAALAAPPVFGTPARSSSRSRSPGRSRSPAAAWRSATGV